MEFYHLNQNDAYEFQVAECGNDGKGAAWSKKSFPVKPIMQLGRYIYQRCLIFLVLLFTDINFMRFQ